MIGFCKIEDQKFKKCFAPSQKVATGAPIPTFPFLLHYVNIMKHPAKV